MNEKKAILVTTKHRGVFFGYAHPDAIHGERITLESARCCLSWTADVRGFVGLASSGPTSGCRVGPACTMHLRDITAVLEVTEEAAKRWEDAPWR